MNNEDNSKKFGLPLKEEIYGKYLGKFYIAHPIGANEQYIGKIKEIDVKRGKIILNPYYGLDYNLRSGKNLYNLINKDQDIFLDLTKISLEPTTRDSVLHNCYLSNKERIEKSKSFFKRFKLAYRILFDKID
mgnify:CR=1 FL=1